jgi:hypothetical protein
MFRKPKFKPKITRIKLNPEQAVLACACHTGSQLISWAGPGNTQLFAGGGLCSGRSLHSYGGAIGSPAYGGVGGAASS